MEKIKDFDKAEQRLSQICDELEKKNITITEAELLYKEGGEIIEFVFSELNSVKGRIVKIKQNLDKIIEENI